MGTTPEESSCSKLVSLADFELEARRRLPNDIYHFYADGANRQESLQQNRQAFSRLLLRWRCLRGIASVNLTTTVQGQQIKFPVCVAPMSMQRMAHPDGELANMRACSKAGTLLCLSTWSTTNMEDVAAESNNAPLWFQLYVCKDREVTHRVVKKAEKNGFKGLVLTIDCPRVGKRYNDERNRFWMPPHLSLALVEPSKESEGDQRSQDASGVSSHFDVLSDLSLCWADIKWFRSITSLPIIVKGVMTAEDARLAVEHGVDGVWVSNHGSRQLDTTPAPIEVLPEVVAAVGGRCEVYLDGGVCTGTDVLKALALGARAVFVGRPLLWGLACGGEAGAQHVLKILQDELSLAMMLCGCASVDGVSPSLVVHCDRLRAQL